MSSDEIRIGRPLIQWLDDSDAGTWLTRLVRSAPGTVTDPAPHSPALMDVLARIRDADVRADGSVRVWVWDEVQLTALREWVEYIAYFTRQNAGEDAHDRATYNSARAALRAIEGLRPPVPVAKGQRWLRVKGARKGMFIHIVGNIGLTPGQWQYENLSASRARQFGTITADQLHRSWELRGCEHEIWIVNCESCWCPRHKAHNHDCGYCLRDEERPS